MAEKIESLLVCEECSKPENFPKNGLEVLELHQGFFKCPHCAKIFDESMVMERKPDDVIYVVTDSRNG